MPSNVRSQATIGVSFSLHRCSELGIDKKATLRAALKELGFRQVRLMSYWNIHEPKQGQYDFTELDWQMDMVAEYGGSVSLCLGKRQPRWPECHMPKWALKLPKEQWYTALHDYVKVVVKRYKNHPALASYQLENEALLKSFGDCKDQDYNRERLASEFALVKKLDPKHPIIMTLSDSWGFPFRGPVPDMYAMSLYRTTSNKKGHYLHSKRPPLFYTVRANIISFIKRRPVCIHELQAEPWLNGAILDYDVDEQLRHMTRGQIRKNIAFARRTNLKHIDLWGLEWWYWLNTVGDNHAIWTHIQAIKKIPKANE